jgi:hypothetical protein
VATFGKRNKSANPKSQLLFFLLQPLERVTNQQNPKSQLLCFSFAGKPLEGPWGAAPGGAGPGAGAQCL